MSGGIKRPKTRRTKRKLKPLRLAPKHALACTASMLTNAQAKIVINFIKKQNFIEG